MLGCCWKEFLTPRELIESCCLSPIMAQASSLLRVTAEENQALIFPPAVNTDRWLTPLCKIFTFWVSRCREMECYDCLYFPYFVVTRSLIAIKIFYYLAKCLKCLEEFWLPHWSINHLRRFSVSKIMTSSTQGEALMSSHWSEPAILSCSLAELSCFSLGFKLRSQKVVTKLCKIPNDLTHT